MQAALLKPRRPKAIPRRLRPSTFVMPSGSHNKNTSFLDGGISAINHIVGEGGDQGDRCNVGRARIVSQDVSRLPLPRNKSEAQILMQGIQERKVACLKAAIFELQKDNTYLLKELHRQQDVANSRKQDKIISYCGNESQKIWTSDTPTYSHHFGSSKVPTEENRTRTKIAPTILIDLSEQFRNLEIQVSDLKRQFEKLEKQLKNRELQVKALEHSQGHLTEKLKKKFVLHKTEILTLAFGLATRAERLHQSSIQSSAMAAEFQQLVSKLEQRYRAIVVKAHACSKRNCKTEKQLLGTT